MNTLAIDVNPRAIQVDTNDQELIVTLSDGRTLSVPLVWFPRLLSATAEQRRNSRLLGDGQGIHWPDVDEDISVAGLLRGERATTRPRH
jgi:hypothetical protein